MRRILSYIPNILLFSVIFLIRFLLCIGIGIVWFFAVPAYFYNKTPYLEFEKLEGHYVNDRVPGDILEFYDIAEEMETYGPDNNALAEKIIIVSRIGGVGFVWVFPALGVIWGLSQKWKKRAQEG